TPTAPPSAPRAPHRSAAATPAGRRPWTATATGSAARA
ncbi:MAG: hypothetical protein AVDCRST_MAG35-3102, partial [uncultured Quadrisphaera sp.]